MNQKKIKNFLKKRPGYLKKSNQIILERLEMYPITEQKLNECARIKREITSDNRKTVTVRKPDYDSYVEKHGKIKPSKKFKSNDNKYDINNVLVIGDLHEPFCLDEYLEHCVTTRERYNCGTIIFIGDVIDNHFASYHETDPDGFGAGEELDRAISRLRRWYEEFPEATVIIGNHDRLIYRKAYSSGLSRKWIRDLNDVLETPNWDFVEEITINNVNYNHGEGGTARARMKNEMQSQVQGHHHNQFYIEYNVSPINRIFGVQVGCGVDHKSYAMAYGKKFKKPVLGCGVILGETPVPHLVPMILENY